MKVSYEGIGQLCATFACSAVIGEGCPVKLTANGTVGACAEGDGICGVCAAMSRDGRACSVQLRGFATLAYTGASAPAVGRSKLSADGAGGVRADTAAGDEYLVVQVDPAAKTATIML